MPDGPRLYRAVETRLVSEYLARNWPDCRTMQRVRVGSIPYELPIDGLSEEEFRMLGVWRRWADAVIFEPPRVHLVEGMVLPNPGKVSQLELYLDLFPRTPEFQDYQTWDLIGRLVLAVDDPIIRELARRRGFLVDLFSPPWVAKYLATLAPRHRRAPLPTK